MRRPEKEIAPPALGVKDLEADRRVGESTRRAAVRLAWEENAHHFRGDKQARRLARRGLFR